MIAWRKIWWNCWYKIFEKFNQWRIFEWNRDDRCWIYEIEIVNWKSVSHRMFSKRFEFWNMKFVESLHMNVHVDKSLNSFNVHRNQIRNVSKNRFKIIHDVIILREFSLRFERQRFNWSKKINRCWCENSMLRNRKIVLIF